jgi:hypothetical protein
LPAENEEEGAEEQKGSFSASSPESVSAEHLEVRVERGGVLFQAR